MEKGPAKSWAWTAPTPKGGTSYHIRGEPKTEKETAARIWGFQKTSETRELIFPEEFNRKTSKWMWVKLRNHKWNPDKWKEGLKPAVPWWFKFDPYPNGNGFHPFPPIRAGGPCCRAAPRESQGDADPTAGRGGGHRMPLLLDLAVGRTLYPW